MISVEEASSADFEQVHNFLKQLNSTTISKDTWEKTYSNPFNTDDLPGFVLKDQGKVVGFFGTIFSRRVIEGKEIRFCNTHSWIVDENYRRNGLLLLNKIHKLQDVVLTNFSASEGPYQIMKQLKWKEIDNAHSIFYRSLFRLPAGLDVQVVKDETMYEGVDEHVRKIAEDHKPFSCAINTLRTRDGNSLQIFKTVPYFPARFSKFQGLVPVKLNVGQLYYASNPEVFFSGFRDHIQAISKKEGWIGVVIPNRMLQNAGISPGKKYYAHRPVLAKTTIDFDFNQLDLLYSEVIVLDLK